MKKLKKSKCHCLTGLIKNCGSKTDYLRFDAECEPIKKFHFTNLHDMLGGKYGSDSDCSVRQRYIVLIQHGITTVCFFYTENAVPIPYFDIETAFLLLSYVCC